MKKNLMLMILALAWTLAGAAPAWAQYARVAGKVTNNDVPQPGVQVIYKSKNSGRQIKMKTNKNGEFMSIGVPIDAYSVTVIDPSGKAVWNQETVPVGIAGDNDMNSLNIDLTKGATANSAAGGGAVFSGGTSGTETFRGNNNGGVKTGTTAGAKMSKEEYEKITAEREKAVNTNAVIKQVNDAMTAKNWQAAEAPLQQLTAAEPGEYQFQKALGDTEYNLGKYDAAVAAYNKGVEAAQNMKPDPKNPASDPTKVKAAVSEMLTQEGNAYLKLKKSPEATEAFKKAAAASPNPGPAAYNLCVVNYNAGNATDGIPACNQAITADPTNAKAYFLKGSLMMQQSKQGKDGKLEAPEGTAEALNKYLELQPDGEYANDAKQMLDYIGAKIQTTYKAGKKK